jgi:hypothetical protein
VIFLNFFGNCRVIHALSIFLSYAFFIISCYYCSCSSSRDQGSSLWIINSNAQKYCEILWYYLQEGWSGLRICFLKKIGLHHSKESVQNRKGKISTRRSDRPGCSVRPPTSIRARSDCPRARSDR